MSEILNILDQYTVPGALFTREDGDVLRCYACAHRCRIKPGRRGVCQVRYNDNGLLKVPYGYVAALQVDPVEKKPFFHFFPGSDALTFGMLGCDFHCGFCQNWITSQVGRDPRADLLVSSIQPTTPRQMAQIAQRSGAGVVVSSYNEPLITSEWAMAVFAEMQAIDIPCGYVSNGNATPEVLDALTPYLSAYKVDLKTMQDRHYRQLGGVLNHVLDTIRGAHERGLWVEVVTLLIPGFNDDPAELWDAARFLASVSPDIPWHITAYHPDYKMDEPRPTTAADLVRAAEIGEEAGLHFVYAGNLPGRTGSLEDTRCPACQATLVGRTGFTVRSYRVTAGGACPDCGARVPGVWSSHPEQVRTGRSGWPRRV